MFYKAHELEGPVPQSFCNLRERPYNSHQETVSPTPERQPFLQSPHDIVYCQCTLKIDVKHHTDTVVTISRASAELNSLAFSDDVRAVRITL